MTGATCLSEEDHRELARIIRGIHARAAAKRARLAAQQAAAAQQADNQQDAGITHDAA